MAGIAAACVGIVIYGVLWRVAQFALWILNDRHRS